MGQYRQVLIYGTQHPDRSGFWKANPTARKDPVHDGLYKLCHGDDCERGDVTMTEPSFKPKLVGVCLTSAYEDTTLRVTLDLVDDEIQAKWAAFKAGAEVLGVFLDEPEIWLGVVEVA